MTDDALEAVALLRRLLPRLGELGPDGAKLRERARVYLREAPNGMTLDGAIGVETQRGQLPWWRQEADARRNAAIVELARFYPDRPARKIASELLRYGASAWRHDKALSAPPGNYLGTAHEFLFLAYFASEGRKVPTTERQIANILGKEIPGFHFDKTVVECKSPETEIASDRHARPARRQVSRSPAR